MRRTGKRTGVSCHYCNCHGSGRVELVDSEGRCFQFLSKLVSWECNRGPELPLMQQLEDMKTFYVPWENQKLRLTKSWELYLSFASQIYSWQSHLCWLTFENKRIWTLGVYSAKWLKWFAVWSKLQFHCFNTHSQDREDARDKNTLQLKMEFAGGIWL